MFGLVPFANAAHKPVDFWVVIGALFVITCLVVVRQVLALRENGTLLRRLDASLLEARGLQDQLRHQATHDALTGLANRALFDERLDAVTGPAPPPSQALPPSVSKLPLWPRTIARRPFSGRRVWMWITPATALSP